MIGIRMTHVFIDTIDNLSKDRVHEDHDLAHNEFSILIVALINLNYFEA